MIARTKDDRRKIARRQARIRKAPRPTSRNCLKVSEPVELSEGELIDLRNRQAAAVRPGPTKVSKISARRSMLQFHALFALTAWMLPKAQPENLEKRRNGRRLD